MGFGIRVAFLSKRVSDLSDTETGILTHKRGVREREKDLHTRKGWLTGTKIRGTERESVSKDSDIDHSLAVKMIPRICDQNRTVGDERERGDRHEKKKVLPFLYLNFR